MRVKLIATTPNPIDVMWTAARTCYSTKSPVQMWEDIGYDLSQKACEFYQDGKDERDAIDYQASVTDKHLKLVKAVLDSGHMSIAEHVNFTFAIEGISRACSHQLVRHRLCTFSQQSQRYVEIKEDLKSLLNLRDEAINNGCITTKNLINLLDKYFVDVTEENAGAYLDCLIHYVAQTTQGKKPEDARNILPNATKTNIVVTTNLRNLIHISELRLCTRAQKEIIQLFKLIKEEVTNNNEVLGNMLMAQCDRLGYCPEASKCCGKRPTLQDNLLSKADFEQLMNACEDPQVNEKLIKLMKMKSAF
jgi:thymidylate synthase (FAD)